MLKQNAFFLNFLENFAHSPFSALFSLKCAPLLPQYWATHILEHWDYCNTQISIGEEGESHKCFKICDEYCSSLTNWLDWLANVLIFMLRKGINFNAFMIWIKITAIADENDWFFISDQICPADVSRLQQPGFWAYLQCCKCCIDCFVIQLLSEPDKLKSCSLLKARLTLLQYHQLLLAIPASKRTLDYFSKKYPEYANNWLVVTDSSESRNGESHGSSCRMEYLIILLGL